MKLWPSLTAWRRTNGRANPAEPAPKDASPERVEHSLRTRLLFFVVLALLPAATVSIVQGLDRIQRDNEDVRALLVQTARATASDEQNLLASAEQILRAHANQPDVRQASPACDTVLANALLGLSFFPNIMRLDAQGNVVCSALPHDPLNFSDRAWWAIARQTTGFFVSEPDYEPLTRSIVLGGVLPLRNVEGAFDGTLNIALDVQWLDFMLQARQLPQGAVAALFNQTGSLITATNQDEAAEIFRGGVLPELSNRLLTGVGRTGETWSYAVAPLSGSNTYLGFAMPNSVLFRTTYIHVATDLLLPVLMLGLASVAIWIATDRLVLRWIAYLRRMAVAYSRGHYAIRPTILKGAPSEFRTLGEALTNMASAVDERDRSLRDAVAQKTNLIREIHHRVKNNLQIVMSLLSLQAGQLRDPAARDALRETQIRVNALALVHRILHELENVHLVDINELLSDLVRQVHEGFGAVHRDVGLELDILPRQMMSDLAVPLTLFTVEALTNAFKHAFPGESGGGTIRVSLKALDDASLQLSIEDNGLGLNPRTTGTSIGSRLMRAFSAQVNGTSSMTPRVGGGTSVTLVFPDPLRSLGDSAEDDDPYTPGDIARDEATAQRFAES